MSLDVNFGDSYPARNHISLTVVTDQGMPCARVTANGKDVECKVRMIDENKNEYKVRFFLPAEARGELKVVVKAGSETVEETKTIKAADT